MFFSNPRMSVKIRSPRSITFSSPAILILDTILDAYDKSRSLRFDMRLLTGRVCLCHGKTICPFKDLPRYGVILGKVAIPRMVQGRYSNKPSELHSRRRKYCSEHGVSCPAPMPAAMLGCRHSNLHRKRTERDGTIHALMAQFAWDERPGWAVSTLPR